MARGAGEGRLFEGGDCYKYFRQRGGGGGEGDYSRDGYYSNKNGILLSTPLEVFQG